jgi:hypothetical protein
MNHPKLWKKVTVTAIKKVILAEQNVELFKIDSDKKVDILMLHIHGNIGLLCIEWHTKKTCTLCEDSK